MTGGATVTRMASILLMAVLLLHVQSLRFVPLWYGTKGQQRSKFSLLARKHRAFQFGNFVELPRPADPKKVDIIKRLDLKEKTAIETGADLRKTRTRNLKVAITERPVEMELAMYPRHILQRKWSESEIAEAIECLNLSYGKKSREELTESERIGVIDWDAFDVHASAIIPNYEDIQKRKKVYNWIKYHIKKKDIVFDFVVWKFIPRPNYEKKK